MKNFYFCRVVLRAFFCVLAAGAFCLPFAGQAANNSLNSYKYYVAPGLQVDALGKLGGTILVKDMNDKPLQEGVPVMASVAYATAGGNGQAAQAHLFIQGVTDPNGKIEAYGTVSTLPRKVLFTAADSVELTVSGAGQNRLPEGFLTGRSLYPMQWVVAQAYCASHGGRLPLVNQTTVSPPGMPKNEAIVENFGGLDTFTPWPDGLGRATYWTGTEDPTPNIFPRAWTVTDFGTAIPSSAYQHDLMFAVCLPGAQPPACPAQTDFCWAAVLGLLLLGFAAVYVVRRHVRPRSCSQPPASSLQDPF